MLNRLSLRVRVFLFFAALAVGAIVAIAGGLTLGYRRLGDPVVLDGFAQAGIIAGFATLGLIVWVWFLFDANVAKPIDLLAAALRARTHSDIANPLQSDIARYLGDLAPAASATAQTLAETRNALSEAVARETIRLSQEKDRLERLLSDVEVGVILCSGNHQLVFYNGTAAEFMGAGRQAAALPGLDRRLFDFLREGPILHSLRRLIESGDPDAASDLLCTTVAEARVLSGRMRLVQSEGSQGYVLTLREVTRDMAAHARREALVSDFLDQIRRPAAALHTLMAVVPEGSSALGPIEGALRQEVDTLATCASDFGRRIDEIRSDTVPFSMARGDDLLDGLRARMELDGLTVETAPTDLLVRCNGYELIALFGGLAGEIARKAATRRFRLALDEDQSGATLRLLWSGKPVSVGGLEIWLAEPLEPNLDTARRSVLLSHATDLWPEPVGSEQSLCLPIRNARRFGPRPKPLTRRVVYDFDLMGKERNRDVLDTRLEDLTYVVFDTETTGLLPQQGDEIVQIAAVRIVNGRRVGGEVFDTRVNPRRAIPAVSTEVHGISDAMVKDAPFIEEVGAQFHRFAEGSVLIAHNAPFDMAFLRRIEPTLGLRFDMPVLDTVLLSAVVFSQHDQHSLDALTHRLGITISEEARHTAIGDAVATADAFLKLLPVLQARGFNTFGQVLAEVRRHGRLLKDINT